MTPNPNRVAAGKRNRALRRPLSAASIERIRAAAFRNEPWLSSTGPRTQMGKQISARNAVRHSPPSATIRLGLATLSALRTQRSA